MILFFNEDTDFRLNEKRLRKATVVKIAQNEHFKAGDISFIFCSDEYLLKINKQYLNHDYYTDVITFDYTDNKGISGDIYISVDSVKANALEFQVLFQEELNRVICHGILHLCGYKDTNKEEKKLMRTKEDYYLEFFKTATNNA